MAALTQSEILDIVRDALVAIDLRPSSRVLNNRTSPATEMDNAFRIVFGRWRNGDGEGRRRDRVGTPMAILQAMTVEVIHNRTPDSEASYKRAAAAAECAVRQLLTADSVRRDIRIRFEGGAPAETENHIVHTLVFELGYDFMLDREPRGDAESAP